MAVNDLMTSNINYTIEKADQEDYPILAFLEKLNMEKFSGAFIQQQYKDTADLIDVTAEELAGLGVTSFGNKKKINEAIKEISSSYYGQSKISNSIEEWCSDWFVSEYSSNFTNNDVDTLHLLAKLGEDDLTEIGINNKLVIRRILKGIGHLKQSFSNVPATLAPAIPNKANTGKEMMLANSNVLKNEESNLTIYQPNMELVMNMDMYRKLTIGLQNESNRCMSEKVIMVLGATGAGKTTLINAFVNYLFGVDYNDPYRFKLLVDPKDTADSQATSQTSVISAYQIRYQDGFAIPFNLTIIDTPGFGDTRGFQRDIELTKQIQHFFKTKEGIDHIDAVGFVCQSSLARLTPTQNYIFDSILSLFGKDIGTNIFLLLTFADGKSPQALEGIKKAGIPYNQAFKFNNSVLYSKALISTDYNDDDNFDYLFWKMGTKSCQNFFNCLKKVSTKSLLLTQAVLDRRERIETQVIGLQQQMKVGLYKLERFREEYKVVQQNQSDIDANKNFKYQVPEETVSTVRLDPGTYTTTCMTCNRTCHDNCAFNDDNDKKNCCAMDGNGYCTACPNKCYWSLHKNVPYIYIIERKIVEKESNELLKKFKDAKGKQKSATIIIKDILKEFDEAQLKVVILSDDIRQNLAELAKIALKPNPLSTNDYIEILIQSEQSEHKPGWVERVAELKAIKEKISFLEDITQKNWDPLKESLKDQAQIMQKYNQEYGNESESRAKAWFKQLGSTASKALGLN